MIKHAFRYINNIEIYFTYLSTALPGTLILTMATLEEIWCEFILFSRPTQQSSLLVAFYADIAWRAGALFFSPKLELCWDLVIYNSMWWCGVYVPAYDVCTSLCIRKNRLNCMLLFSGIGLICFVIMYHAPPIFPMALLTCTFAVRCICCCGYKTTFNMCQVMEWCDHK